MKILISTTNNQPPTASRFCQAAKDLGHQPTLWFPQSDSLPREAWDFILLLSTALDYKDDDLDQVEAYIEEHSSQFLNLPSAIRMVRGKERQVQFFEENQINHIPSLVIMGDPQTFKAELENLHKTSQKIVIKPFRGNGGKGVMVYQELQSLYERLQKDYQNGDQRWLLQPWVENNGEIRVLWLGDQPLLTYAKKQEGENIINNLNAGASAKIIPEKDIPEELLNCCRLIRNKTKLNFYAVDFLHSESGMICLEINTSPGLIHTSDLYQRNLALEILKHEIEK